MLLGFLPAKDRDDISSLHLRLLLRRHFGLGWHQFVLVYLAIYSVVLLAEPVSPLLFHPIEVVVVFEATIVEKIFEDGSKTVVIRPFFKRKLSYLLHVSYKLHWDSFTQLFKCHLTLLSADRFVLCLLIEDLYTLPREVSAHEVDQHEAEALKVVSPRLLLSQMGVQTCIPSRSSQTFVVSEGNVFIGARVFVSLCEAIVNHVDIMLAFADAYQIIIWLNVAVQKTPGVNVFNSLDHLVG